MERLRGYLRAVLVGEAAADGGGLAELGFRARYLPQEIDRFDELEFARPLAEGRELVLSLALEEGRIARMLLGWAPAGDDDADVRALTEERLAEAFALHGESILALLDRLTG